MINILNTKWIKQTIWYVFSSKGQEAKKVSEFLKEQLDTYDTELNELLDDINCRNLTEDRKVMKILRWVNRHFTYVSDRIQYKEAEHWATIGESLSSMKGDCEDGAILIYCLARKAGIPIAQIKLVAGNVKGGGHAWVRYISKKYPLVVYFIDWCYWYDTNSIGTTKTAYFDYNNNKIIGDDNYYNYWFLVDEDKGYKKVKW